MALGLTSLWLVPRPHEHPLAVRGVFAALFAGGVARLLSLIVDGAPDGFLTFLMIVELVVPPITVAVHETALRRDRLHTHPPQ